MKNFGYLPDIPDIRDFSAQDVLQDLPRTLKIQPTESDLPKVVDNRKWCSPIENQGSLGSCTANAAVSMFEYMQRKADGKHIDGSRLFVYYNTRKHAGLPTNEDTGSYIRSTIKAIVLNGIPEESRYPYIINNFRNKPPEDIYSDAQNFKATKYVRLDNTQEGLIQRMRSFINNGYSINFGFGVYECINDVSSKTPVIPFPARSEQMQGGHAVTIVGYDSEAPSRNSRDGNETKGAFLCQNSWGTNWGNKGFFYIPDKYFETGLAVDVWTVTDINWVNTKHFD